VVIIDIIAGWEQFVSWLVLLFILYAVVSSKVRQEAAAFGGLLLLGALGISEPAELFSGFSNPALFTVIIVLVMSEGLVASGMFTGFGKSIARRIHKAENQIVIVSLATWLMSFFVNNVGVIGVISPTAERMSKRAGVSTADFGLPIVYATFLGGSVTLISTVSNLIVSSFRTQAFGQQFGMFDFAAHGIAMSAMALLLMYACRLCGYRVVHKDNAGISKNSPPDADDGATDKKFIPEIVPPEKRSLKNTVIVLSTLLPAILLASFRLIHPSIGFGLVVVLWIIFGILPLQKAFKAVNLPILLFLGSMLSLSEILNQTRALPDLVNAIMPLFNSLPAYPLILALLFITAILSNILDNAVSALLMAPAAILLFQSGAVSVNADALLMAVAAGASLGIVIPTHQATIVAMNSMGFEKKDFIRQGTVIAVLAGIIASVVILIIWN